MRVILLIGLPGSGKSTWAAQQNHVVLSSDQMRFVLCGDETNQTIHAQVFAALRYLLRERLKLRQEATIIDATNLRRRDRRQFRQIAREHEAEIEAVFFDVPFELALARNRSRQRVVPEEAMHRLAARLEPPSEREGYSRITTISA
jgi:predicted kinase